MCVYVHNVSSKSENNIFIMFYTDSQYNRQLELDMKPGWTEWQSSWYATILYREWIESQQTL
jgi:hypothetical protein